MKAHQLIKEIGMTEILKICDYNLKKVNIFLQIECCPDGKKKDFSKVIKQFQELVEGKKGYEFHSQAIYFQEVLKKLNDLAKE